MERMRPRVLSAGAEPLLLETRSRVIESAGFDVVPCLRGIGAGERFTSEKFDAVVLGDFGDPGIRSTMIGDFRRINPQVPILVIHRFEDAFDSFSGADQTMDSLAGPETLVTLLRQMLRRHPGSTKSDDTSAANAGG